MRVYRDVRPLQAEDYEQTLARFAERVRNLRGVRAVFQFGSVSHPGVSDLDVLVVVADDVDEWTLRGVLAATEGSPLARYLFTHPPLVVPESQASRVRWVHTLYGLRQVWGEPLEVPPPPEASRYWLELAEYVDFTFSVRSVLRSLEEADVGLRGVLHLLNSCAHSLRLASRLLGRPVHLHGDSVLAGLRQAANGRPVDVTAEARKASEAVVQELRHADRQLAEHLTATGVVSPEPVCDCLPWADGRYYVFEFPYRDGARPYRTTGSAWWRRLGVDPRVEWYPAFYLSQFCAYAESGGDLGRAHRLLFGTRAARLLRDPGYREVLHHRIDVLERVHEVVRRGGLSPLVPLGLGFRSPARIRPSRRRRWLRPLLLRALREGRP